MKRRMKKEKFYSKALLTLATSAIIIASVPSIQYAATSDSDFSIQHSFSKFLTTVGVSNPHQDTFTAYMYDAKELDSSISTYRTYYGLGEKLRIKVTFTSSISTIESPSLVLKFGSGTERTISNCILGSSDTESSGDDYIIFEYTLQEGDTGGLQLLSLSGIAKNSDGYAIEMALPSNANVYSNKIIAETVEDGASYTYQTKTINTTSSIYILDNNTIRPMVESDIKLIKDVNVSLGSPSTVSIIDSKQIQILTDDCNYVCVPNAVDIAGNPISIHFAIDGSEEIYPMLSVTALGNKVDGVSYCKAGDEITIVAWEDYEDSTLLVKFGEGNYKNAIQKGHVNGYVTWSYTIQNGDNGLLTIQTSGSCYCGAEFDDNEVQYNNVVADTIAPVVNISGIYLNSGTAYYSSQKNATKNSDVTRLYIGSGELVSSGTVWTKKDSTFIINWSGVDETGKQKNVFCGLDSSNAFTTTDWQTIVANKEGLCEWYAQSVDYAGNTTTKYLKDDLTLICDATGPKITVTTDKTVTNEDTVDFVITSDDPNITDYLGSGVQYMTSSGEIVYKTVNQYNIKVSNGSIIKSSTSENKLTITVMPQNDGYVSVYVPEKVVSDNVENYNTESNIVKVQVDRTAPVITDITGVPTDWTESATITVIAYDAGVGLHKLAYSYNNDNNWTSNNSVIATSNPEASIGNGKLEIFVRDDLGNQTSVTVNLDKIGAVETYDTTPPVITDVLGVPTNWTNEATLTIIANDEESGLADEPYSFDGGITWTSSSTKVFYNNGEVVIYVKDKVENMTRTVVNISKIGSEITFDTTTSGTCIKDVKEVVGVSYIIVDPGTTAENLLKYISSSLYRITVKNEDKSQDIENASVVSTNNNVVLDNVNSKYIIVVKGDVNADGKINLSDIIKLNKARLGKISLTKTESLAADVSDDGKINLSDIIKLNKYRLGKINNL